MNKADKQRKPKPDLTGKVEVTKRLEHREKIPVKVDNRTWILVDKHRVNEVKQTSTAGRI